MTDDANHRPPLGLPPGLHAALDGFVRHGELCGALALVVDRDGNAAHGSVGCADPRTGMRFALDTLVRVHSMSKPLTTAAFLTLVEAGTVSLDTPLADVLPEFAVMRVAHEHGSFPSARPITMEHLLTHTSGLTYANASGSRAERSMAAATADDCSPDGASSLAEWAARASRAELASVPGEAWTYGVGIDVIGRVIEVLTGHPLEVALRERLFEPVGMRDTGFRVAADARHRVAPILRRAEGGRFDVLEVSLEAPPVLSAGGGIVSTAADYTRFLRMLVNDGQLDGERVLSPDAVLRMRTDRVHRDGSPLPRTGDISWGTGCGFGLGGRVVRDPHVADYGSPGTYGWDGIAGMTFFVDFEAGRGALLVTQVLPWPAHFHEIFRGIVGVNPEK